MSWLRTSPLRQSLPRRQSNNFGNNGGINTFFNSSNGSRDQSNYTALKARPSDNATDCDPRACYDSFCKHWQQAYEIIQRVENMSINNKPPTHDDVLGVVSHLDYMVTLLLVELHNCNKITLPDAANNNPPAPCLEYMLSENLLDKLYEWGRATGRYSNAVRLEQLKLYELLVSHSRHQLLCHEPFLRPLLKILASSQGEIFPPDLEKRLVILLNQLCVLLMQNVNLLDLFFFTSAQETQSPSNFIIFSLLIPYVHREGSLGHQARDALLLCMALSQKNSNIGTYIAQYSSMCPLLVTGLGGLYSRLPNTIEITSIDWHRITPDDVTDIPELSLFMNALEFCNAVVQVAHEMIKTQLLDFMYQGFIVPVLGPAILQKLKGKHFQTNIDSQISAMCYLDLILRSITERSLLKLFLKFLLDSEKFDGERILDVLIERLSCNDTTLCLVTMALFDTLLNLYCEDILLELLLKYLLPAKHVPISQRYKINQENPYANVAEIFLELTPEVMKRVTELTRHKHLGDTAHHTHPCMPSPTSTMSKTIGANWNYYGLHTGDSLYANYHAYLLEAHYRIMQCAKACSKWSNHYKYQKWPSKINQKNNQTMELIKQFLIEYGNTDNLFEQTCSGTNGNMTAVTHQVYDDKKQLDSLQSLGESSGYESFKWRPPDDESSAISDIPNTSIAPALLAPIELDLDNSIDSNKSKSIKKDIWRQSSKIVDPQLTDLDFSEDLFTQGSVSMGPFMNAIWSKLQTFTSNNLYVNLHLTGLISRLACFPLPLIQSILLRPDIVITSDTPSFFQILRILKQQIDAELPIVEDSFEVIDVARSYLIDREFRLINTRKIIENVSIMPQKQQQPKQQQQTNNSVQSIYASISASSPVQVKPSSSYDPFKRSDIKRKSISKSLSSMFSRKSTATPNPSGLSQIYAFFTGISPFSSTLDNNTSQIVSSPSSLLGNNCNDTIHETTLTTPVTIPTIGADALTSVKSNASVNEQSENAVNTSIDGDLNSNITTATRTVRYTAQIYDRLPVVSSIIHTNASDVSGGLGSEPVSLDSLSSTMGAIATASGGTERTRDLALCALILDEWLKELAAIAQEQSVAMINIDN